jgi:hypothetical protein
MINLGFLAEGKNCCYIHQTLLSGFPNWPGILLHQQTSSLTRPHQAFSGAIAGEEVEDLCKGSFSHTHPLLCFKFCFTLFLLASFYIKNPKKLESLVVVISLL